MKKWFLFLIMLPVISFRKPDGRQVLTVSNLDRVKGKLYIGWYRSEQDFRKADRAIFKKIVEVNGKESVEIPFENVPAGTYAIAVFLDENDNGKIDTKMFGIPKEKYGFSNNKYPLTRAASFKESAFDVGEEEQTIEIKLKG
jgi:uncharacterized protein (DUF2141 family)